MANEKNNNSGAKYYDEAYHDFINQETTLLELNKIKSLVKKKGRVLDLGCGTGRHLIPLHQDGYKVIGIDTSSGMIHELKTKLPEAKVVEGDIYSTDLSLKPGFDLAIIMFNAIAEISSTERQLNLLLSKLYKLLKSKGSALIDISNISMSSVEDSLNFSYETSGSKFDYKVEWKVKNFNESEKLTRCLEHIVIFEKGTGKVIEDIQNDILQKWWTQDEIEKVASQQGFNFQKVELDNTKKERNTENIYIILTKKK